MRLFNSFLFYYHFLIFRHLIRSFFLWGRGRNFSSSFWRWWWWSFSSSRFRRWWWGSFSSSRFWGSRRWSFSCDPWFCWRSFSFCFWGTLWFCVCFFSIFGVFGSWLDLSFGRLRCGCFLFLFLRMLGSINFSSIWKYFCNNTSSNSFSSFSQCKSRSFGNSQREMKFNFNS